MILEKRRLAQYLLILAYLIRNAGAANHGVFKGRTLRPRGLKSKSSKQFSEDEPLLPRQFTKKTKTRQGSEFSNSRIGVLGQEKDNEDPFVQAEENNEHNAISPYELDVDTSELDSTTTDQLLDTAPTTGDTKEAWNFTEDTITSNFTSMTYTTVVSGNQELIVTKFAAPTKMPTPGPTFEPTKGAVLSTKAPTDTPLAGQLSPPTRLPTWTSNPQSATTTTTAETLPPTPLSAYWTTPAAPVKPPPLNPLESSGPLVVSKAEEAGENVVAGVTQTLAQGTTDTKGAKGVKNKEATAAKGTNPKGVKDKGAVAASEGTSLVGGTTVSSAQAAPAPKVKGVKKSRHAGGFSKDEEATVSSAQAAPAPKVKGVNKSRSYAGGFTKAVEATVSSAQAAPAPKVKGVKKSRSYAGGFTEASPVGTTFLGPVNSAQEAGQSIVAGVTGNLVNGKRSKGAKSTAGAVLGGTTIVSSAQGAPAQKVKGMNKSKVGGANAVFWNSKFNKSKKSAKSTDNGSVLSAFGVSGGKGGGKKSNKASAAGNGSILSAQGFPIAGGKSKGKSKSSVLSSTFEPPGQTIGQTGASAPTQPSPPPRTNTPAPITIVSSVIEAPLPAPTTPVPASPSSTRAPGPQDVSPGLDCDAIAEGTASTEADNQSSFTTMADWLLEEGAEFEKVARDVQQYLQTEIAPAIAGCEINRRRKKRRHLQRRSLQFMTASALITNVVFGTPRSEAEGTCRINQVQRCFAVEGDVDMYYYGSDRNLGMRLLTFLRAGIYNEVEGLLGVVNLKVFDSNGNEVEPATTRPPVPAPASLDGGTTGAGDNAAGGDDQGSSGAGSSGAGTSAGGSTSSPNGGTDSLVGDEEPESESISGWSKTVIGVSTATAFLAAIICCYAYNQWQSAEDMDSEGKRVEFGNLSDEGSDQEAPTNGSQAQTTNGVFYLEDTPSRTWPDNEDEQSNGSGELDKLMNPLSEEDNSRIQSSYPGTSHQCSSGYCQVCAESPPRVKFISSIYEPELPEDATRNYHVKDTVAL